MGLLKHFRSRSRLQPESQSPTATAYSYSSPSPSYRGRDYTQRLPDNVLGNIFSYVCPHTQDQTYEPSERSQVGDGCMLCDLRDLACCTQVCRKWCAVAQRLLYTSVRIDAVHYCALEDELAERRKKAARHFRSKGNVISPGEVPNIRLALLCRTVREQSRLADQVLVLKLPYMTRETAKGDVARTVSALPNLRYVDLPDGFFTSDPSCLALRQELQARCPEIRKMSYRSGSEEALQLLTRRHWLNIEVLDLQDLAVEPSALRIVLASLPTLHDLTLSELPWVDDSIFQSSPGRLPDFPPLHTLKLENVPNVTALGLTDYLEAAHNREVLSSLSLQGTGVTVADLHKVLWKAPCLRHLTIVETVSKSLPLATSQLPPLASISLRTLHFEITSSDEIRSLQKPAESYYDYLASSLHQNALPALSTVFVREANFPELLTLPPVSAPFAAGSNGGPTGPRNPLNGGGFTQTLEVFAKGIDELEWVVTFIAPPQASSNGTPPRGSTSGGRPLSAYSASRGLGPQWAQGGFGGEARKSVVVGNGFGGFLAVPQEEVPRPMTADGSSGGRGSFLKPPPSMSSLTGGGHERRGSRHDLWR